MTTISPELTITENTLSPEAQKVRQALLAKGIETPTVAHTKDKASRRAEIQQAYAGSFRIARFRFER